MISSLSPSVESCEVDPAGREWGMEWWISFARRRQTRIYLARTSDTKRAPFRQPSFVIEVGFQRCVTYNVPSSRLFSRVYPGCRVALISLLTCTHGQQLPATVSLSFLSFFLLPSYTEFLWPFLTFFPALAADHPRFAFFRVAHPSTVV